MKNMWLVLPFNKRQLSRPKSGCPGFSVCLWKRSIVKFKGAEKLYRKLWVS